jgi:hypothetical protein
MCVWGKLDSVKRQRAGSTSSFLFRNTYSIEREGDLAACQKVKCFVLRLFLELADRGGDCDWEGEKQVALCGTFFTYVFCEQRTKG